LLPALGVPVPVPVLVIVIEFPITIPISEERAGRDGLCILAAQTLTYPQPVLVDTAAWVPA
jgi:hypothetical protein